MFVQVSALVVFGHSLASAQGLHNVDVVELLSGGI
jgi:hypothetical protein